MSGLPGIPHVPEPGALVAGCVIEGELGRGAMGAVFRARDPQGRAVAVKVMLSSGNSRQRLERFRREVELTQGLSHPGIVKVLGGGVEGQMPCLVLELVEGSDLEAVFSDQGSDLETKLRLVEEVARAVDYAHSQGVVHRDLKPANVLVSNEGRARVTDFGLARDLDRKTRLTVTGQGLGTPAYMAPEQVMGEKNTGAATDVYALGVILFEALTGDLPFDASTPMALYDSILKHKAPRPSTISPLAAPYDRLTERALAKDPAKRVASAGEFARELEALRLGLGPQRGGILPWLTLTALLVGAAALAAWIVNSREPAALPPSPAQPLASASPAPFAEPAPTLAPSRQVRARDPQEPKVLGDVERLLAEGDPEEAFSLLVVSGRGQTELAQELQRHFSACDRASEFLHRVEACPRAQFSKIPAWLEKARAALSEAEPRTPQSPRALWLASKLADLRLEDAQVKEYLEALVALRAAPRREETYNAYLVLAEWASASSERESSLKFLRLAIKLRPKRAEARLRLLASVGRSEGWGSEEVEALSREFPDRPEVLNMRAAELFRDSQALAEHDPKREEALLEAERLLLRGIDTSEAPSRMLIGLAYLQTAQGRSKEAAATHARALKASRERGLAAYWYWLGNQARQLFETRRERGGFIFARKALLRASAVEEANPSVKGELAILRWVAWSQNPGQADSKEEVRDMLYSAVQHCPADWETHFYLGQALRVSPAHQQGAARAFESAIRLKPDYAGSYLGRGRVHLALGNREQAKADAKKALALSPGWKSAQELLRKAER